ncbi:hypothetical protein D3C78_1547630 [compost metagenome]
MAASTAELSNSTINANRQTAINNACSTRLTFRKNDKGIRMTLSNTSCRKAASPVKAARRPSSE